MKYQLTLNNGAKVTFDTYQMLKKGMTYKNGSLEVYMTHDMFHIDSLTRIKTKNK